MDIEPPSPSTSGLLCSIAAQQAFTPSRPWHQRRPWQRRQQHNAPHRPGHFRHQHEPGHKEQPQPCDAHGLQQHQQHEREHEQQQQQPRLDCGGGQEGRYGLVASASQHHHHPHPRPHARHSQWHGPLRPLRRVVRLLACRLHPQGPGGNDKSLAERLANVTTCGMFFQAGRRMIRLCHSAAARRFGWAFVAVGAVATLYHASWGRLRPLARKVDYWAIAASSMVLRAAVLGPVPAWLAAAMAAAVPFKPTLVSTGNFVAVEVRYLLLALAHPALLPAWAAHTGMSAAATACFSLDEVPPLSRFPYTHAAFHVLSAAAFLTLPSAVNQLTQAREIALLAAA